MLCVYFADQDPHDLAGVAATDHERWRGFFRSMLESGVHLPPSPYEAWFLSTAHDEAALAHVLEAAERALA